MFLLFGNDIHGVFRRSEDGPFLIHIMLGEPVSESVEDCVDIEALSHFDFNLIEFLWEILHVFLEFSEFFNILRNFIDFLLNPDEGIHDRLRG